MAPLSLPTLAAGALPVGSPSHVSGGRDLWSPPRLAAPPREGWEEEVWACLREVLDPELPISLVDLGLVYGVEVEAVRSHPVDAGAGPHRSGTADQVAVTVQLTFTATACPCMDFIREDVQDRLIQEPWVGRVAIEEVWDPPWTRARITPEGRRRLRSLGVGA